MLSFVASLDKLPFQLLTLPLLLTRILLFWMEIGGPGLSETLTVGVVTGSSDCFLRNSASCTGDPDLAGVAADEEARDGASSVDRVLLMNCCFVIWWARSATWRSVLSNKRE